MIDQGKIELWNWKYKPNIYTSDFKVRLLFSTILQHWMHILGHIHLEQVLWNTVVYSVTMGLQRCPHHFGGETSNLRRYMQFHKPCWGGATYGEDTSCVHINNATVVSACHRGHTNFQVMNILRLIVMLAVQMVFSTVHLGYSAHNALTEATSHFKSAYLSSIPNLWSGSLIHAPQLCGIKHTLTYHPICLTSYGLACLLDPLDINARTEVFTDFITLYHSSGMLTAQPFEHPDSHPGMGCLAWVASWDSSLRQSSLYLMHLPPWCMPTTICRPVSCLCSNESN